MENTPTSFGGKSPKTDSAPMPASNGAPKTLSATATEGKKLSGAELKKQQKAEKAAKRAAAKRVEGGQPSISGPSAGKGPKKEQQTAQSRKAVPSKGGPSGAPTIPKQQTTMPVRGRRSSITAPAVKPVKSTPIKQVSLFGHLYGQPRRYVIEGATKEVHPAILALGLQMSSYEVCGSTARCVAMLLAFKSVIQSYHTPHGHALARHFIPHYLSPQIDYLKSCRPISITMGNAIRVLKDIIANIDPSTTDDNAKRDLCNFIDGFIRERITAADELIADTASSKIAPGDVILAFAKSSLVLETLLWAKRKKGIDFRVIVLDSKPLFEGKRMALDLAAAGIPVQYSLIPAAAHAVAESTKVFLGAHAMMANGRLYSRVGTAIVAMLAHDRDIPVIVCCESLKFTDRVALDSIVVNEVAPAEELLYDAQETGQEGTLKKWQETPNLQILNILYDVTPAEMINMVVTEFGSLPPSSVPAVLRILEDTTGAAGGR